MTKFLYVFFFSPAWSCVKNQSFILGILFAQNVQNVTCCIWSRESDSCVFLFLWCSSCNCVTAVLNNQEHKIRYLYMFISLCRHLFGMTEYNCILHNIKSTSRIWTCKLDVVFGHNRKKPLFSFFVLLNLHRLVLVLRRALCCVASRTCSSAACDPCAHNNGCMFNRAAERHKETSVLTFLKSH